MIKEIEGTILVAISVPADLEIHKSWFSTECEEVFESDYRLLGTVIKDKIGFDAEPYVEKTTWHFPEEHIVYRNYAEPLEDENSVTGEWRQAWNKSFATKEESFYSRLAENGIYFENPIKEIIPEEYYEYHQVSFDEETMEFNIELYNSDLAKWQSYEDRIVEKLLIIQKIKSK